MQNLQSIIFTIGIALLLFAGCSFSVTSNPTISKNQEIVKTCEDNSAPEKHTILIFEVDFAENQLKEEINDQQNLHLIDNTIFEFTQSILGKVLRIGLSTVELRSSNI